MKGPKILISNMHPAWDFRQKGRCDAEQPPSTNQPNLVRSHPVCRQASPKKGVDRSTRHNKQS